MDYDPLLMLPGPTNVSKEVYASMIKPIISHRSQEFRELYTSVIEKLQQVLNTKSIVIPLTASGTGAIEAVISTFFKKDDKLIILDHGVFGKRAYSIAIRKGLNPTILRADPGDIVNLETLKAHLDVHNEEYKALYVVYNETSTGVALRPLEAYMDIAKKYGLLTIVDAISIVGGDHLFVDKWNIDVCIGGSQKAIAAPPVLSFVSISEEALSYAKKFTASSLYFDLKEYINWYIERRETPVTPAVPLFYAFDAALERLLKEGLEKRVLRHIAAAKAFYTGFELAGLNILPKKDVRSNTVIAVKTPQDIDVSKLINLVAEYHNVYIAGGMGDLRGKIFRVGSMGDINIQFIIRTLYAIFDVLVKLGLRININEIINEVIRIYDEVIK